MKHDSRTRLVFGLVAILMGGCGGDHSSPTAPSLPDALKAGVSSVQAQPGTTPRRAAANSGSDSVQQPPACQNGPRISWAAEPPANVSTGDWIRGRAQVDPTSGFSLVRQWCDETGPNREWTRAQVEALGFAVDTECPPHSEPGTALTRVVAVPQDQVSCERAIIEVHTVVSAPAPTPAPTPVCPAGMVAVYHLDATCSHGINVNYNFTVPAGQTVEGSLQQILDLWAFFGDPLTVNSVTFVGCQ
jgi:hypothetical protein